jgi:hypothetical protein
LFLDVRTYRGCEIGSDHYLIQAKLRIPPKWLKTPTNIQHEKNQCYKIKLLYDESIRWLFTQRVTQQVEKISEHDDIESEWENIKTIINTAANESLGKCTIFSRKKKVKIWDEEIKQIIHNKNLAYTKYLNTKQPEDKINYRHQRAITKR